MYYNPADFKVVTVIRYNIYHALIYVYVRYGRKEDTGFFGVVVDAWHAGMSVAVTGNYDGVTVYRILQNFAKHPEIRKVPSSTWFSVQVSQRSVL